jgi:hypothetical protein
LVGEWVSADTNVSDFLKCDMSLFNEGKIAIAFGTLRDPITKSSWGSTTMNLETTDIFCLKGRRMKLVLIRKSQ